MAQVNARVFLTLRRPRAEDPFEWRAVRGLRMHFPDWPSLKIFTYRDGPVVFAVEEKTGLCISLGRSVPKVREELKRTLCNIELQELEKRLKEEFDFISPGPRPEVTLKTI